MVGATLLPNRWPSAYDRRGPCSSPPALGGRGEGMGSKSRVRLGPRLRSTSVKEVDA